MQAHDVRVVKVLQDIDLVLEPYALLIVHAVFIDYFYSSELLCLLMNAFMDLAKSA